MTMLEERVSSIEGAYDHLATKADVQELRGEMNTAVERLRGDLRTEMETMRGDLRNDIRNSEVRMIKWGAGMMIGNIVANIIAMAALLRLFLQ